MAEKRKLINDDVLYDRYRSTSAPQSTAVPTLDELYKQITTRPAFQYDVASDPLYQQYRDRYVDQGKLSMMDTMGQAAGLTGGYGSSYGQAVGQQAYDRYMQGLTDKIPELYDIAYNRYQAEGNRLMQQYSLAKDRADTEYARQQDSYQRLYSLISTTGYVPTDAELEEAGMPREVAARLRSIALMKNEELAGITDQGVRVGGLLIDDSFNAGADLGGGYYSGGDGGKDKGNSNNTNGTNQRNVLDAMNRAYQNGATKEEVRAALAATPGLTDADRRWLLDYANLTTVE